MCYIVTISTDMQEDLSLFNQELLFFEKIESSEIEKSPLLYPYKYEIATMYPNNCSCYLRIFEQDLFKEIGFYDLQDWLKEEIDESIINTRQLFRGQVYKLIIKTLSKFYFFIKK